MFVGARGKVGDVLAFNGRIPDESGFETIRTVTIEANIDPECCSINDVGEHVT